MINISLSLRRLFALIFLPYCLFFAVTDQRHLVQAEEELIKATAKVAKAVDPKQLACLAKNIFYEASGESIAGQAAVARVVLNRIQHGFGSTPCSVVYQTTVVKKENEDGDIQHVKLCQFSWVCEGKGEPSKHNPRYQQAKEIAYDVLAHDAYHDVVPKSTLFFHNTSVDPGWPYKVSKKIGNHVFYSKTKNKGSTTKQ